MEEVVKFGGGASTSILSPLGIIVLIITIILILLLPREKIIFVVLAFFLFIPQGQQIYIGGVHLYLYRIVTLVTLIKCINIKSVGESVSFIGGWNSVDTSFFFYIFIKAIAFSLQYKSSGAIIHQVALFIDTFGIYLSLRFLLVDTDDIERVLKFLSFIYAVLAVTMLIEQVYNFNLFGYISGNFVPEIRNDSIRSSGSFRHALTAGTTGAAALPLFFYLWFRGEQKKNAVLGMVAATIMVITSHSSGPLLAYVAGILALLLWPLRNSMRLLRRGLVFSLLILHFVMKAPVWFIIAKIDLTGSSSSYHRANLVDQFIKHFGDWWLIGTPEYGTWGWFLWDVQNQYVSVGLNGGLGALIFFIAIFVYCFSMIGKARINAYNEQKERFLWALGASLFSYIIGFIGVNIFDQSQVIWFMLLAFISVATINRSKSSESIGSSK